MILFPNAKINIGLNILRRRADGFHDIESLFYPLGLSDILEIVPSAEFNFSTSGLTLDADAEDNLVVKAFRLVEKEYKVKPVAIHLHKIIPFGAGLGGGSADATFTIIGLNELFGLGMTDGEIAAMSGQIGSDCPFFAYNKPMIAQGTGNILSKKEVDLSAYQLLLVKPPIHVPTALAYSKVVPSETNPALTKVLDEPIENWQQMVTNGFEESVFAAFPEIGNLKKSIQELGAVYTSMSGSGASVFGLFSKIPDNIDRYFPDCFIWHEELKK